MNKNIEMLKIAKRDKNGSRRIEEKEEETMREIYVQKRGEEEKQNKNKRVKEEVKRERGEKGGKKIGSRERRNR